MQYEEFIDLVQERAMVDTEREALIAIEATLKTLGERLTDIEAAHLAVQLPPEIGRFLTVVDTNKNFDLETFFENVSQRELLGQPMSRDHARAVLSVVEEIVSPGELRDVLSVLPDDYLSLFTFGNDWRNVEER